MPKKMHPVDISDRENLAQAIRYNVHLRRGPAFKINEPANTLAEAAVIADRISAENDGKPAMIYGILPNDTAILVPKDMIDAARAEAAQAQAEAQPLTGSQIAQLSALITGGGMKRSNTKAAAEARFVALATEKGIVAPEAILRMPFAQASAEIARALRPAEAPATGKGSSRKAALAARDRAEPANEKDYPAPARKMLKRTETAIAKATKLLDNAYKPKKAAAMEAAQRGELPEAPDFSADTHKPFRKRLEAIKMLVVAGDVAGLKADTTEPKSSSRIMLCRFRDLAIIALEAQQKTA